ncbi:carbamoyltransferase HypF [Methylococcus sp. EFPC2]|uniref:carbamoyltransferase HypF n=1 Tax=Methylococcus sp. EFPC2 TaxID=2812648 RepID=UPI001967BD72|nr:carbamoyltransferase HypF [Methylococcus sp. EFPC2]QSA97320.1 carbamoyltransferase HypF [Methylococcus sp. EFPC2]
MSPPFPAVSAAEPVVLRRIALQITGLVQGVGFRPYVYRLATEAGLAGWVANTPTGVSIEAEGSATALQAFLARLPAELPPLARIESLQTAELPATGERGFRVRLSEARGPVSVYVPPDAATCPACLAELFDPANRRHRYPFISCTDCGPRWSITQSLPFDRERTVMQAFPLCPACLAEYQDPGDRRFHAQTQCCPVCGPQISLHDAEGLQAGGEEALGLTVQALRSGAIVALQGLGGFQLLADAGNEAAVSRLRSRKSRPAKPFAVMVGSLEEAGAICEISDVESRLLSSAAAPIVLLRRRVENRTIAAAVAPDNPWLGVMVAYTPLHHLLLAEFGAPLVCTSGNRSGEPICTSFEEAKARLGGIADAFLYHDRPVLRALDDSVAREIAGEPLLLRCARGYEPVIKLPRPRVSTPSPFQGEGWDGGSSPDTPDTSRNSCLSSGTAPPPYPPPARGRETDATVLAVGGHLKNTVALTLDERIVLSQHLSDPATADHAAEAHFSTPSPSQGEGWDGGSSPNTPDTSCHSRLSSETAPPPCPPPARGRGGDATVLAVGGHLKNTVALALDERVVLSQHLGDLDSAESRDSHRRTVADLETLFGINPDRIACDLHPDYASSRLAEATGIPLVRVQHHYAHVLSCMAEHGLEPPLLGIAWDGVGLGPDGTLWGGEFLRIEADGYTRIGRFRPFPLPGGEQAVREPRRAALGLLYAALGEAAFARDDLASVADFGPAALKTLAHMLKRGINTPLSSGVGRLFDGVAALLGLKQTTSFEGEAAMALEFAAERDESEGAYPYELIESADEAEPRWTVDWTPLIPPLLEDSKAGHITASAGRFHRTLAEAALAVAERVGLERVALTGGVFQNRLLSELVGSRLASSGFEVHRHRFIPPNDGGLALGQLRAAAMSIGGSGLQTAMSRGLKPTPTSN